MQNEVAPTKDVLVAELARLREGEAYFRSLAALSGDFYYRALRRGAGPYVIDRVDGAARALTGRGGPDLLHAPLGRGFVHPEDLPEVLARYAELAPGHSGSQEYRVARPDREVRWVRESYRCEAGEGASELRLYGVVRDITGDRRDLGEHRHCADRFRSLFDEVPAVAVQGYDETRRVIYWNAASEKLYGYQAAEALGQRLEDLIIPDFMREDVIRAVERWVREDQPIEAGELTLARKDQSLVPVFSSHVMQKGCDGGREMFCLDVDLTELNRAREELLAAKEAAEAASQTKSEFLANMSHELRTPLNGVMGMLQLLQISPLPPQQAEYAGAALQSCRRLNRLLSNILDLCRAEAGKINLRREPFSLADTVRQVGELFRPLSGQSDVSLDCHLDPRLPTCAVGDAVRLQQVLSNLVGNAVKFTRQGGVRLEAYPLPPRAPGQVRVLFSIVDTGVGIPPEKLGQLFTPFTQAGSGYTREFQGAGLGLAICKRLVDLMEGHILIDSVPGEGTAVHFCAVFGQARACGDASLPGVSPSRPEPGSLSILLVEDEPVSRHAAKRQLEEAGHRVRAVKDGVQALEALRGGDFDVVLMDVQMPRMDGVEATRRIRRGEAGAAKAGIPVVALTACALTADGVKLTDLGMDACVDKPFEPELLQEVVAGVLRRASRACGNGDPAAAPSDARAEGLSPAGGPPASTRPA